MLPSGRVPAGSVMSRRSVASRAFSAAASSAAFFAAMAAVTALAQAVEARPLGLALLGAHAAERLHQRGDASRLAECGDPHRLQRLGRGGGVIWLSRSVLKRVGHGARVVAAGGRKRKRSPKLEKAAISEQPCAHKANKNSQVPLRQHEHFASGVMHKFSVPPYRL